jgi:P-type conjugative transfer protein TrbJ
MRFSTSPWIAASLIALAIASSSTTPARAQLTVIDPANLAQSITQVSHMVEQLRNQAAQIEQATAMLRQNPLQLSPELSQSIGEARALFESVEGLAFEADQLGDDLRTLYPETWAGHDLEDVLAQSDRWLDESRASLRRAMEAEARAARSIESTRGRIDRAVQSSSAAEGQSGAIQAGNQLLGSASGPTRRNPRTAHRARPRARDRTHGAARARRARRRDPPPRFPQQRRRAADPARTAF